MTMLTMVLLSEDDTLVFNRSIVDPGQAPFSGIGNLSEQIHEFRETIEYPLENAELFVRVGNENPNGLLLYWTTTSTILTARAVTSFGCNHFMVISSANVDKYIGDSAPLITEMLGHGKGDEPNIIFMDDIDAIWGRRFSKGTSADREIQRKFMELLNQLDDFDYFGPSSPPLIFGGNSHSS